MGRYEEVLEAVEQAISLDPNDNDAFWQKSRVLISLGRYLEAIEAIGRAIELDPINYFAFKQKGIGHNNLERS